MQISLRSQMIAGTAAVVGASAIAMTPVVAAPLSGPSLGQAAVSLSAFANPLNALLADVGIAGSYLLNSDYSTAALNWPFSGIGAAVNAALLLPENGGYSAVGIVPQTLNDNFPILTQLVDNQLGYLTAIAEGGLAIAAAGSELAWLPVSLGLAVFNDVVTGQFDQILTDVQAAVVTAVDTITEALTVAIDVPVGIVTNVVTRATALFTSVAELVPSLINGTIGQVTALATSVTDSLTAIGASLATLNPENIWNTSVEQLLSPAGIPGALLNLTAGAGVQVDPVDPYTFVPSVRTEIQTGVKAIAGALATPVATSAAAEVAPAAAAAVAASAATAEGIDAESAAPEVAGSDAKAVAAAEAVASEGAEEQAPAAPSERVVARGGAVKAASGDSAAGTPKRAGRGAAKRAAAGAE